MAVLGVVATKTGNLNLREAPSPDGALVGSLPKGTALGG